MSEKQRLDDIVDEMSLDERVRFLMRLGWWALDKLTETDASKIIEQLEMESVGARNSS